MQINNDAIHWGDRLEWFQQWLEHNRVYLSDYGIQNIDNYSPEDEMDINDYSDAMCEFLYDYLSNYPQTRYCDIQHLPDMTRGLYIFIWYLVNK